MSSSKPVRIAIVGTGLIGPRHAEAVLQEPEAELACIVDPNPAAEAVAEKLQCPLYASVALMLASASKPDAAIVCTPNHTHVSVSKELLAGGVHVLCEKPISVDVGSGSELIEAAAASNLHLLIGHHRRFNRYVVTAKNIIPSLGRIVAINGLWTIHKPDDYFDPPSAWRRLDSAGPVFINLVHDIDILHHLFGPIVRVQAEGTVSQRGFKAEEGAAIILKFESGTVGTFLLSDAVVSPHSFEAGTGENPMIKHTGQDFYRIFGSEGTLSVPDMTRWHYPDAKKSWSETLRSEQLEVREMRAPFALQVQHFVAVIRGKEKPVCPGHEGLRAMIVCEAVKKALREGQPVDIKP